MKQVEDGDPTTDQGKVAGSKPPTNAMVSFLNKRPFEIMVVFGLLMMLYSMAIGVLVAGLPLTAIIFLRIKNAMVVKVGVSATLILSAVFLAFEWRNSFAMEELATSESSKIALEYEVMAAQITNQMGDDRFQNQKKLSLVAYIKLGGLAERLEAAKARQLSDPVVYDAAVLKSIDEMNYFANCYLTADGKLKLIELADSVLRQHGEDPDTWPFSKK